MSSKPINDWEITGIYFASLPDVPRGALRASFVEDHDSADQQPTLIPCADDDENEGVARAVRDDYFGP